MENKRIDEFISMLAELSAFLCKIKRRENELQSKAQVNEQISEAVESYLNGFSIKQRRRCDVKDVDSKLNSKGRKKTQNRQIWTKEDLSKMPYLKDLKYRQTQDGIHQFRYRRDGYNVSFNSKNYETAKKKAYDFIKSLKRILRNCAESVYGKTFDYVAEAWLALKQRHTTKKTHDVYSGVYKNHIKPVFGKRAIKNILPIDLQPFFDELFSRQEKTCEDAKIIINAIFDYAVANRLCPSNPMKAVIVAKHVRTPGKALTDEQLKRFRTKMVNDGNIGTAALILLYTGARGAELNSIRFNWEEGTFCINNAKLKSYQKLKSENLTRTLPIFPGLYKIKDLIEANDAWRVAPATISSKFCNVWLENTVKDLRHTFASKCREAGIENELVNLWQGHTPGRNVTANVYTHFSMDFQKEQAKRLDNY